MRPVPRIGIRSPETMYNPEEEMLLTAPLYTHVAFHLDDETTIVANLREVYDHRLGKHYVLELHEAGKFTRNLLIQPQAGNMIYVAGGDLASVKGVFDE